MVSEVPVERLRRVCDPQMLGCDTTAEIKPLETIIGQDRAVKSLQFGLGIKGLGFNIYVAGTSGTGKATAVERFLEDGSVNYLVDTRLKALAEAIREFARVGETNSHE